MQPYLSTILQKIIYLTYITSQTIFSINLNSAIYFVVKKKKKKYPTSLFFIREKRKTCCNANTRGWKDFFLHRSIILLYQPIFRSPTATTQKSHAHAYDSRIARIYLAVSFVAYLNINYKRTRLTSPIIRSTISKTFDSVIERKSGFIVSWS